MAYAAANPKSRTNVETKKSRLLEIIKQRSLLKGEFKLASGVMSDYYLDMKPTTFDPEGISLIAEIVCDMLKDDSGIDSIGGLELGAVPIIAAVCAQNGHTANRPTQYTGLRKTKMG